jgi:hypothetical protein
VVKEEKKRHIVRNTGPRAEKIKKNKCPCLSKEFVDKSDGDDPAQFASADNTASTTSSNPKSADQIIAKVSLWTPLQMNFNGCFLNLSV